MKLVFFDLETGGLDPAKHPVAQIAAVAVDDSLNEIDSFECKLLINIEAAEPEALKLFGFNAETWRREAYQPRSACLRFSDFLNKHADIQMTSPRTGKSYQVAQLAGYNAASFDGPFIQSLYKSTGEFLPASYRVMCVLQRVLWRAHEQPGPKPADFKLATICQHYGIPIEGAHDAMVDVRATVALYRAIIKGR